jgi:hypothetical protein
VTIILKLINAVFNVTNNTLDEKLAFFFMLFQYYDHYFRRFLPILGEKFILMLCFGDSCQFSAKNLAFFLKSNVVVVLLPE